MDVSISCSEASKMAKEVTEVIIISMAKQVEVSGSSFSN